MDPVPPGIPPAGFFLSLLTESFAVRAFLGSVVAAGLAAGAMRGHWVRSPRARRLVLLAPVLAAGAAAAASLVEAETYLPQLWIASAGGPSGQVLELLGELRVISNEHGLDLLFLAWAVVATVLLARRVWGATLTARLVRRAAPVGRAHQLQRIAARLSAVMDTRDVRVRLLDGCPGGALATGIRRPVVVVDPALLQSLDAQEAEGLLAHEIAHVARRDTLLAVAVGVFSDLTFFLPTVHLAGRWLRSEREESADEWASEHTRRPAALASGILKVWERSRNQSAPLDLLFGRPQPLQGCAAVPIAVPLPWRRAATVPQLSDGARIVAARVERLVAPPRRRSSVRSAVEISVAAAVIVAASAATLVVPPWIANDLHAYSLAIGYVPPPAEPVESPAFSTFRALAPVTDNTTTTHASERTWRVERSSAAERVSTCPCVETQAQWLSGTSASAPHAESSMAWRRTANPSWDVDPGPGAVRARPLLTLRDSGPQLGFFVVAQNQP